MHCMLRKSPFAFLVQWMDPGQTIRYRLLSTLHIYVITNTDPIVPGAFDEYLDFPSLRRGVTSPVGWCITPTRVARSR